MFCTSFKSSVVVEIVGESTRTLTILSEEQNQRIKDEGQECLTNGDFC